MQLNALLTYLYGIHESDGFTDTELNEMQHRFGSLPDALTHFYKTAGHLSPVMCVQDTWITPAHYEKWQWMGQFDGLVLMNENQGVCQAVIRSRNLGQADPPVCVTHDMGNSYQSCNSGVSAFIRAMLIYQSVFRMPYTPDAMFWLTDTEARYIEQNLHGHPYKLHHWIGQEEIRLFSLAPDSALYLMGSSGEWQMWYGARSRESFSQLEQCLDGIGEEL